MAEETMSPEEFKQAFSAKSDEEILALTLPDFLRMMTGELNGMQAFTSGRLKISGDLMFSQALASWFKDPIA